MKVEKINWETKTKFFASNFPIWKYKIENFGDLKPTLIETIDEINEGIEKHRRCYEDFNEKKYFQSGSTSAESVSTSTFNYYNFLEIDKPEIIELRNQVQEIARHYAEEVWEFKDDLWFVCWGNKIDYMEFFTSHFHSPVYMEDMMKEFCMFSAHINVQSKNTYTVYESPLRNNLAQGMKFLKNEEGVMTVFPYYIPHKTTAQFADKNLKRYTIAMDIKSKLLGRNQFPPSLGRFDMTGKGVDKDSASVFCDAPPEAQPNTNQNKSKVKF